MTIQFSEPRPPTFQGDYDIGHQVRRSRPIGAGPGADVCRELGESNPAGCLAKKQCPRCRLR